MPELLHDPQPVRGDSYSAMYLYVCLIERDSARWPAESPSNSRPTSETNPGILILRAFERKCGGKLTDGNGAAFVGFRKCRRLGRTARNGPAGDPPGSPTMMRVAPQIRRHHGGRLR